MIFHTTAKIAIFLILIIIVGFYILDKVKSDRGIEGLTQTGLPSVVNVESITSRRAITTSENISLPIKSIVPDTKVNHSIATTEIRQGCSRMDCIPSVDSPEFISTKEASSLIDSDQIGIALSYKGENRFYPFSMLVTKEIVNDVVASDPLLITYCPLCGTGIVFDRVVDGQTYEFGVSGMLWQSNLLMYNRAELITDRNLWSQVLGEAVVGGRTGTSLTVVPSDIMKFGLWESKNLNGLVLNTGSQRDPYGGEYYAVAKRFEPNYDPLVSPMAPDSYIYGIEVSGVFKAYPRDLLPVGEIRDMINGEEILISNKEGIVRFEVQSGEEITDTEGFWFSWVAAHPETLIWTN